MEKKLSFFEWITRVEYGLVAVGTFKRGNDVPNCNLSEKHWKPLYYDGLTPIEAVIEMELNF